MRTIIRYSLNRDTGSALGNQLDPVLKGAGLKKIGTRSWDGDIDERMLRDALRKFWRTMNQFQGNAHLDHFWMYADNRRPPGSRSRKRALISK